MRTDLADFIVWERQREEHSHKLMNFVNALSYDIYYRKSGKFYLGVEEGRNNWKREYVCVYACIYLSVW